MHEFEIIFRNLILQVVIFMFRFGGGYAVPAGHTRIYWDLTVNRILTQLLRTIVTKNLKSWEECLPFIKFAYNICIHSSTSYSPFELVYGFNPLTPLDLLPLPVDERVGLDGKKKAELVKQIPEKAREHIIRKTEQYASQANQGRKRIVFEPGDWVWLHMRKERFPAQRRSKLQSRGDGPFQVLERINDNAY